MAACCFGWKAADVVPAAVTSKAGQANDQLQGAAADGGHSVLSVKIKDDVDFPAQAEGKKKKNMNKNKAPDNKKKQEKKASSRGSMELEQTAGLGSRYFSMGTRPSPL